MLDTLLAALVCGAFGALVAQLEALPPIQRFIRRLDEAMVRAALSERRRP